MEKQPRSDNGGENLADDKEKIRVALEEAYDRDPEGFYDALDQAGFDGVDHIDDLSDDQRKVLLGKIRGSVDPGEKADNTPPVAKSAEANPNNGEDIHKKNKKLGNKVVTTALVAALAGALTLSGIGIYRFFGKKDQKGANPSGTPTPTPTPVVAYDGNLGPGANGGSQGSEAAGGDHATGGNQGSEAAGGNQSAEQGEQQERLQFTDAHKYFYEESKMLDGTRIPGAYTRAELIVGESYFEDLSDEERKLIVEKDETAEGYEAAVRKLATKAVMRECLDSREVTASYIYDIEQVAPGTFAEFGFDSGMSAQEIVKRLYDMDDEAASKCLNKLNDTLDSEDTKTSETKIQGYYENWREEDSRGTENYVEYLKGLKENGASWMEKDAAGDVKLVPMLSHYETGMPVTQFTLPNGGVIYVRMLTRNIALEDESGNPSFICYDMDGNVYYGCGQPLLPLGETPRGGDVIDEEHPPEVKDPAAIYERVGDNYTQLPAEGAPEVNYDSSMDDYDYVPAPADETEGYSYVSGPSEENDQIIDNSDKKANDDVHEPTASTPSVTPDDKDKEQKADEQAEADSQKAKELEDITDEEASAMFGF